MCSIQSSIQPIYYNASVGIDEFVDFIFIKNNNNINIELPVENNKELLCFCIDLMCRGLVLLFGSNKRIELDNISMNDFEIIKNKMALAGIHINLNIIPNIENKPIRVNIRDIDNYPDNLNLKDFKFTVITLDFIYSVTFEIKLH